MVWLGSMTKKYMLFLLTLVILAIIFYTLFPKYKFHYDNTVLRTNIITGKVELFSPKDRKWINLSDNLSKSNHSKGPKWADVANSERYKTATPEVKIKIQNKYFNDFVKTAPGYRPDWEWEIRSELFGDDLNTKK